MSDLIEAHERLQRMSPSEVQELVDMFNGKESPRRGDDHLSSNDRRNWELCYEVIRKYQVPVIFKHYRCDVPRRMDERLEWFVPCTGQKYEEIKQYIYYELRKEIRQSKEIPVKMHANLGVEDSDNRTVMEWYPGFQLEIYPYSGLNGYLGRDVSDQIVKKLMLDITKNNLRGIAKHHKNRQFGRGLLIGTLITGIALLIWRAL